MKIKEGQLVILESGEYSDYGWHMAAKALKDFDTNILIREYKESNPDTNNSYERHDAFIAKLIDDGYLEEVDVVPWHIGSYGRLEERRE